MSNYHFITHWQMDATCEEVYRTLEKVEDLPRWWPSVYLDVKVLEKGQAGGVGKLVDLYTKGWLPYKLRWQFKVIETDFPKGFTLTVTGDFNGIGVWTFRPAENGKCDVIYDWRISAEKPLLKKMSWLLRPIFSANHEWAMRQGMESLRLELLRNKAKTAEALSEIQAPPAPTFTSPFFAKSKNKILTG
ncbi:MAG: polyketide cyclase [Saprospiraceae bacterium]|nr:polyketide cyclase [Saprospiraceae bacterium]